MRARACVTVPGRGGVRGDFGQDVGDLNADEEKQILG